MKKKVEKFIEEWTKENFYTFETNGILYSDIIKKWLSQKVNQKIKPNNYCGICLTFYYHHLEYCYRCVGTIKKFNPKIFDITFKDYIKYFPQRNIMIKKITDTQYLWNSYENKKHKSFYINFFNSIKNEKEKILLDTYLQTDVPFESSLYKIFDRKIAEFIIDNLL